MSLSQPAERELLHTRKITCVGYKRSDGLYDIEGHLIDNKTYDFDNKDRGGKIRAGEALHAMHVRITLDLELVIQQAEAVTEWGPFNHCKQGAASFKQLKGLRIGPDWRLRVNQLLSGVSGCTHITELLRQIATTALQTMGAELSKKNPGKDDAQPHLLNSCYALAENSPVVKREWPKWYRDET